MSGRKLGYTGGTADKLECFDGYKTDITITLAKKLVKKNNACLISQTEDLAPADKYIYKLRDETDTVMDLSLIASSIMSKKLASGNDIIVLDVKTGTGAFMKTKKKAEDLAKLMVKIGKQYNKKTVAIVTDMNQPLGYNVGSLLETIEAIEVLEGKTGNLYEISLILASKIIEKARHINFEEAKTLAGTIIKSGTALKKLKKIISAQKGSLKLFDKKYREKILLKHVDILSKKEGYISAFDLELLGNNTRKYCSAGNLGIKTHHKLGDYIKKGDALVTLYGEPSDLDFSKSFHVSKNKPEQNPLVYEIIE